MKPIIDSFFRALAYCLVPRVILWSLLPLLLMVLAGLAFAYWGWQPSVAYVQHWLDGGMVQAGIYKQLEWMHLSKWQHLVPTVFVLLAITPVIVVLCLLVVAGTMMPTFVNLVAERRFPTLERKKGAGFVGSVVWSLGHTLLALVVLVLSMPFWLIPPVALVLPPLIWGWLGYRVMSFDALSEHASKEERKQLLQQHRMPLLIMGVITGLMGAAPGVVWASTALFVVAFVVLIPVAIWIYTLVFAFSSLWFCHYCMKALSDQRAGVVPAPVAPTAGSMSTDASGVATPTPARIASDNVQDVEPKNNAN